MFGSCMRDVNMVYAHLHRVCIADCAGLCLCIQKAVMPQPLLCTHCRQQQEPAEASPACMLQWHSVCNDRGAHKFTAGVLVDVASAGFVDQVQRLDDGFRWRGVDDG